MVGSGAMSSFAPVARVLVLAQVLVLAGCGGDDFAAHPGGATTSGSGGAGGAGATSSSDSTSSSSTTGAGGAGGEGGSVACRPVTLGEVQFVDTRAGGSATLYTLLGLDPSQESALFVEFYDVAGPQTAGTFDLSQPPDDNYATCAHCLFAFEDLAAESPIPYFQTGGSLLVTTPDVGFTGASEGSFEAVVLSEVTLEGTSTTPVPGGRCLALDGSWVSSPVSP
jgi:hypothetical protein